MCGIVGIHGPQEDQWLNAMNDRIVHRGPDGDGTYRDRAADLAMAMRRLAIIDLEGGRQPMTTADGRHTIVFNGEIFNAPELRRELEDGGVRFQTDHSDTEVLLNGIIAEGEPFLARLNGMFAFAVYDRQAQTLFCARDHAGIKPFYYFDDGRRFAFASELKSLLALPPVARRINPQSLFHYMSLMYVPGRETIIDGVNRLEPGCCLHFDLKSRRLETRRWWRLEFKPAPKRSAGEWRGVVREQLAQAVDRWTLSDVPLGCLLSGGLDSSAVVGLLADRGVELKTYSLGFAGPNEAQWSELPIARATAAKWGTDHHEVVLNPETLLDDLPAMVWHMDEPYGGGLPSWSVFKFLGQHVKVALTGTGGDELFGNYFKFRELEGGFLGRQFGSPRPASEDRFRDGFFERFYYCSDGNKRAHVFGDDFLADADSSALLYAHFAADPESDLRDRTARTDFETQLPEEFLAMTDRFSMAHNVEARTPFLDRELIETVMSIPASVRLHHRQYKKLLRDSIADLFAPEVLVAPKKGFVIPLSRWLRGPLRSLVEHLLEPGRLARQGIFRPSFFQWAVEPHLGGQADNTTLVWGALMFQLWHATFIEGDGGSVSSLASDTVAP